MVLYRTTLVRQALELPILLAQCISMSGVFKGRDKGQCPSNDVYSCCNKCINTYDEHNIFLRFLFFLSFVLKCDTSIKFISVTNYDLAFRLREELLQTSNFDSDLEDPFDHSENGAQAGTAQRQNTGAEC